MPLRYAPPPMPPLPGVPARPPKQASGGGGGGGSDPRMAELIKKLTGGGAGQSDQLAQALASARTPDSGPTIGQSYLSSDPASVGDSYLPVNFAGDPDPDIQYFTNAQLSDAIGSAQAADALSGFNWAAGV